MCVLGRRFAAALLPRPFGMNPRSHHKGATGRVRTGDQRLPVLCRCQLGQDREDTPFMVSSSFQWRRILIKRHHIRLTKSKFSVPQCLKILIQEAPLSAPSSACLKRKKWRRKVQKRSTGSDLINCQLVFQGSTARACQSNVKYMPSTNHSAVGERKEDELLFEFIPKKYVTASLFSDFEKRDPEICDSSKEPNDAGIIEILKGESLHFEIFLREIV